jgi:2-keto-4-pentenoate hydratase/2-oxohepta-3-ene-1,7-dioic acid hydratase in catechol pathway
VKLANILVNNENRLGMVQNGKIMVIDKDWSVKNGFPTSMNELFLGSASIDSLNRMFDQAESEDSANVQYYEASEVNFAHSVPTGKKIICVGLNYKKHADESNMELPKVPLLFSKFDNTLTGNDAVVIKPDDTEQMDFEAEVGVVIARQARNISVDEAMEYVFGFTNANDLSARDLQFITSQWLVGKTCDGFCPVGPYLVTTDEVSNPNDLKVTCTVNGTIRQNASTSQMIFPFAELISYISQRFTLEPGDLILSGTPDGVIFGLPKEDQVWLQPGDEVIVEVEQLGSLRTIIG